MEEGLRLEFIDGKFSEALKLYQNKALKTTNPAEINLALIAIDSDIQFLGKYQEY